MTSMLAARAVPVLVATLLLAAPAWAQTSTPSPSAPDTGSAETTQQASPHATAATARPRMTLEAMVERRLRNLHGKLHITQAQSRQWDQFALVMRDNARSMDQLYKERAEKLASMSAVDTMQSYAQITQERAQGMQKLMPVFQALYASLSDEQKQSADQLFRHQSRSAQSRRQARSARHGNATTQ